MNGHRCEAVKNYYERRPLEETTDEASIENQKEVSRVLSMNSVATSANSDAVETNLIVWNLCAHLSIHNRTFVVHLRKGTRWQSTLLDHEGKEKLIYHRANAGQCVIRTCYYSF